MTLSAAAQTFQFLAHFRVGKFCGTDSEAAVQLEALDNVGVPGVQVELRIQADRAGHERLVRFHDKTKQIFDSPFVDDDIEQNFTTLLVRGLDDHSVGDDQRIQKLCVDRVE